MDANSGGLSLLQQASLSKLRRKFKLDSTDWNEDELDDMFPEEVAKLQPSKPKAGYVAIKPIGPITGALFEGGKWIPTGGGRKRKRFDKDDEFASHSNLRNPAKKAKFTTSVEQAEIEILSKEVKSKKPPRNVNPVALLQASELRSKFQSQQKKMKSRATAEHPEGMDAALDILSLAGNFKVSNTFNQLPISQYTKHCLKKKGFKYLTDIQKAAIPHALVGRDVLGAAKTGSGKTLSFVVPMLENLYRKAWHSALGLGALLLAPTRELAMQIFDTIQKVGRRLRHLSVGLVVGGEHSLFSDEKKVIHKMAILVGTPGRVLNHFEKANSNFHTNHLLMLILDEADLMLDIGLLDQVQRIMEYLPRKRQTMLFSATLTIDIVKLAKVTLRRPVFLPIDTADACALPKELVQTYLVTPLQHKYNILWSFIQTHVNDKMIIFFATLRQVKFTRRVFVQLRPFASVSCLHSEMKQSKRMEMYKMFKRLKSRAMLLCTEVASRGLDFGNIDWVINFDVPADTKSYIHRVGRAARLGQKGNSITFITEHETGFVKELKAQNIECRKLGVHSRHLRPIIGAFQTILAKDERMMDLAKKSFNAYLAFYYFYGNRAYMDPDKLDKDDLAKMFGLMATPKYRKFLKKCKSHKLSTMPTELKMLLLDNKRKRKQKSELIKRAAEQRIYGPKVVESTKTVEGPQGEDHGNDIEDDDKKGIEVEEEGDAPEWFENAFKDRKEGKKGKEANVDCKEEEKKDGDVEKWLQSESEAEDDDILKMDDDDIETQALAAILDRD